MYEWCIYFTIIICSPVLKEKKQQLVKLKTEKYKNINRTIIICWIINFSWLKCDRKKIPRISTLLKIQILKLYLEKDPFSIGKQSYSYSDHILLFNHKQ